MNSITPAPRKPGRPPKIPRENLQTREMLIRCGTEILTEQGFMATGIDTVLKRVGVPKGSFYHYFDSKEAFGQAVLESYAGYFARKLDRWLLDASLPPLQRLRGFVDEAKAGMARHEFRRGCLVGNLGQEVTLLPDSYREQLDAVFRSWELRLSRCLQAAQAAGDWRWTRTARPWRVFFWIGWEGAVLRARLVRSDVPLEIFMQGFVRSLAR